MPVACDNPLLAGVALLFAGGFETFEVTFKFVLVVFCVVRFGADISSHTFSYDTNTTKNSSQQ